MLEEQPHELAPRSGGSLVGRTAGIGERRGPAHPGVRYPAPALVAHQPLEILGQHVVESMLERSELLLDFLLASLVDPWVPELLDQLLVGRHRAAGCHACACQQGGERAMVGAMVATLGSLLLT